MMFKNPKTLLKRSISHQESISNSTVFNCTPNDFKKSCKKLSFREPSNTSLEDIRLQSQAMHVVRTIGQAFEVCNKFKDSHTNNHSDVEEDTNDVTNTAATAAAAAAAITNTTTMNNKRNTRSVRSKTVNGLLDDITVRLSEESQDDSDNSFKDLNDDFSNLQFEKKLKSGLSKSVEKLTSIPSTGNRNTASPGNHMYSMSDTLPRCSKQKTVNDFLRQNSLPSVTTNDDTMTQYKITNYEWLLVTARLEHEIQETQAAVSQIKLLQNQLQAEKSARIEAQDLIDQLLAQNRELLSHISTLIQQLGNKNGDARSCSIEKSKSPQPSEEQDNYTGNQVKYLTLPSKSPSSSSSSPLLSNHKNNNHKLMETLQAKCVPRAKKQRSIARSRTIIEEDPINNSSHLALITRSFSEKLPQRNLNVLAQVHRSQWARHTTK